MANEVKEQRFIGVDEKPSDSVRKERARSMEENFDKAAAEWKEKNEKVFRLTLFPPTGERVTELVKLFSFNHGSLHYTDMDGTSYETTLPYVVEHIGEGHKKSPFLKGA